MSLVASGSKEKSHRPNETLMPYIVVTWIHWYTHKIPQVIVYCSSRAFRPFDPFHRRKAWEGSCINHHQPRLSLSQLDPATNGLLCLGRPRKLQSEDLQAPFLVRVRPVFRSFEQLPLQRLSYPDLQWMIPRPQEATRSRVRCSLAGFRITSRLLRVSFGPPSPPPRGWP